MFSNKNTTSQGKKEDIPLLVEHFRNKYNSDYNKSLEIQNTTVATMLTYDRPGNARALEIFIERAVISNDETSIIKIIEEKAGSKDSAAFDTGVVNISEEGIDGMEAVKTLQKRLAEDALKKADGVVKEAQRLLKLSGSTFSRWKKGK